MKVSRDLDGNAVITLTFEELAVLRYALNEGRTKLGQTARYLNRLKTSDFKSANQSAKDADKLNKDLESACQEAVKSNFGVYPIKED